MRRRASVLACASLAIVLGGIPATAAACNAARGDRIELTSAGLDPDVFVWDSMQRLVDYAGGIDDVDTVMRHTTLATAGTHAVVVSCKSSAARIRASKTVVDLIGVRVLDGRNRGRYGWVYAADARRVEAQRRAPPGDGAHPR